MDWLNGLGLDPRLSAVATAIFAIATAIFAAWSYTVGKREGPQQPKVQEFAMTGQLADMKPVRELIEQTGLLVQQQLRSAVATEKLCDLVGQALVDQREDREERERDEELEAARRQGYESGLAARPKRRTVRRPASKPTRGEG